MLFVQKFLRSPKWTSPNEALAELSKKWGIKVTKSPEFLNESLVILNYDQIDSAKWKTNPAVMECRGLVLDAANNFEVCAKPFSRFFNFGESVSYTRRFDWESATIEEKLDGSLIILYHHNESWKINTRATFGNLICGLSGRTWEDLVRSQLDDMILDSLDKGCTYVLEYTGPWNTVVVNYPEEKLYLLGVFDNKTCKEIDKKQFSRLAELPKVYDFKTPESIKEYFGSLKTSQFEGVVCRDKNGMRIKLKNPDYLMLHRTINNGHPDLNLLCLRILQNEQDELITTMPVLAKLCGELKTGLDKLLDVLYTSVSELKDKELSQKDFALSILNNPAKSILFKMRKNNDWDVKNYFEGIATQYLNNHVR